MSSATCPVGARLSSSIQTVTVGFGISPNQPRAEGLRVVGCTTGGDFHPALKIMFNCGLIIVPLVCLCNP